MRIPLLLSLMVRARPGDATKPPQEEKEREVFLCGEFDRSRRGKVLLFFMPFLNEIDKFRFEHSSDFISGHHR